jgi:hypothetical protein
VQATTERVGVEIAAYHVPESSVLEIVGNGQVAAATEVEAGSSGSLSFEAKTESLRWLAARLRTRSGSWLAHSSAIYVGSEREKPQPHQAGDLARFRDLLEHGFAQAKDGSPELSVRAREGLAERFQRALAVLPAGG